MLALAQAHLWWAVVVSALAGTLTLAGLVWAAYRVFWGEESPKVAALAPARHELPTLMMVPMIALAVSVVVLGVWPQALYPVLDSGVRSILALVGR